MMLCCLKCRASILMAPKKERKDVNIYINGQVELKEKGISASHFYFCFIAYY